MTATTPIPTRMLGGFPIIAVHADTLIEVLRARRAARTPTELLFANTNFIVSCYPLVSLLRGPETLITNDGIGLDLAARLFTGSYFPDNLNGTDFVPRLLKSLDRDTRVFLLGARRDVVHAAAQHWSGWPHVTIAGVADGYDDLVDDDALTARIHASAADLLLVALGDPRQARWITEHRGRLGVPCVVAVGALFDFASGRVGRAPTWIRRLRLEWLFRLALEPRRLARRYSIDLVVFFRHCLRTHRAALRTDVAVAKPGS